MDTTHLSSAFPLRAIVRPNPSARSSQINPVWPCRRIPMDPTNTQHIQTQDFYLDTFFNPIWMSDPHVLSFNADGTVKLPKATPPPTAHPHVGGKAPSADKTYAAAAKSALSQGLSFSRGRMSPLPSGTKAEIEEVPVKEVEDGDLVYTWPPNLGIHERDFRERNLSDTTECADDVTTSVCASPTLSASAGGLSPMITTPTQSYNGTCVLHRSPQVSEEGTVEKVTGSKG